MAGSFSVTISANDQVSATVKKINANLRTFSAPYEKMRKQFGELAETTGLKRVGGALKDIGRGGREAASSLARIVEPLGIITGAASVAGIVRMTQAWANWGSALQYNSQRAGFGVNTLNKLQNAGRLAGMSAESVTGGLTHLKDAMTDALAGRGGEALPGYLQSVGIATKQLHGDVASVIPQIVENLSKINQANPSVAARVSNVLFGSEEFLRLFGRGQAAYEAYQRKAALAANVTDAMAKRMDSLRESQTALTIATEGFGIVLTDQLAPVIQPVLDYMTRWVATNRQFLAVSIVTELKHIAGHVKQVSDEIERVVRAFGGWKNAIDLILLVMGTSFALKVLSPFFALAGAIDAGIFKLAIFAKSLRALQVAEAVGGAVAGAGEGAAAAGVAGLAGGALAGGAVIVGAVVTGAALLAAFAYLAPHIMTWVTGQGWNGDHPSFPGAKPNLAGRGHAANSGVNVRNNAALAAGDITDFMARGWSRTQANILEGNLLQESGLNENARNRTSGAYGLAQWLGSRGKQFQQVEGVPLDKSTRAQQRAFIDWELKHSESAAGRMLKSMTNENQAAQFGRAYERFGANEEGNRTAYAQQYAGVSLPAGSVNDPTSIPAAHIDPRYAGLDIPSQTVSLAPIQMAPPMQMSGPIDGMGAVRRAGDDKVHVVVEAGSGTKATVKSASDGVNAKVVPGVFRSPLATAATT